jgi:glycolate oxidase FAD binding subunit
VDLMDLEALCGTVATADAVVAVGARTHWEVGGALTRECTDVRGPSGVIRYEPNDLTITVGSGTSFAEVEATLAEHGQECPLDPRDPAATVGGIIASGLSGHRRLRYGPLRDHTLEIRFVRADGRLVKGGGPTVKNVTGYDLVRLFVGSLGTLGLLTQVTLRCRPRADHARWISIEDDVPEFFRASSIVWNGTSTHVLIEGTESDVAAQTDGRPSSVPPEWPDGAHRGRISIAPARVHALADSLQAIEGLRWQAELGIGTFHVAADDAVALTQARTAGHDAGGWMLRERGGDPDEDGFGRALPNLDVMRRIKTAFDPCGKFAPGRLPL